MKNTIPLLLAFLFLSLVSCGPKQPTAAEHRAEKHRQDSIALIEQGRSLAYYDSLYQTLLPIADSLIKEFQYEKNEKYEQTGKYTHRLLRTTQNTSRNYIQAYVKDNASTEVKFFYYGAKPADLHEVILSADSLSLLQEDAIRCLHFIDVYSANRVRVSLVGSQSRAVFYISDNDKKALMSTYRLGITMRDLRDLETHIRLTSLQIEKYQKRLEKQ